MSDVLAAAIRTDPALAAVVGFTRRFGPETTALAMHAALPLGLSPELVHLLRVNFVRHAPFIAEADLLLSPLCTEVGGGMYEMDADVRELLLGELAASAAYGPAHVRRVARFLRVWTSRALDDSADADAREYLRVQQWVALAYDEPTLAAEELAGALRAGVEAADRPEVARVARLTTMLSAPLAAQVELRRYAGTVERAATTGTVSVPSGTGDVPIGRERLPSLDRVIRLWQPATTPSGFGTPQQSTVTDEPPIQQQSTVTDEIPVQQQANVADDSPIQQQANVAEGLPLEPQANVEEEPPIQQQATEDLALTGYRVARVVVVGDPGVGKTALILRLTGRRLSRGEPEPYSTRLPVLQQDARDERDLVFIEPADHVLPLELADAAAVVVVTAPDVPASEERWMSRLGSTKPIVVFRSMVPEEAAQTSSPTLFGRHERVVPIFERVDDLRAAIAGEVIDWRAQPAAPARVVVNDLEHFLVNRLQTSLLLGLEKVLQDLLMRAGGMSSEQAEGDLQGALLCVSARGTVRLAGEKQQQLVSGLAYARGVELIWRAAQERESVPPHLPAIEKDDLERIFIDGLHDVSLNARPRELLALADVLVDDLVRTGWAYRVEREGLVIPSLFQGRAHEGEQLTPGRPLLQASWSGRVQDVFVLLLVHMAHRGYLRVNSPRAAQVTLVGGHVSLASAEGDQRALLTLAGEVRVQEAEQWKHLVRNLVVRYLPPGASPEFRDLDPVTAPPDPPQPPKGVDLAQACLVVLPRETSPVDERRGNFDAVWEHLFKPAIEDTWLPEGSSLVPVRIQELPPGALPDWMKATRLVVLDVTGLQAPEIRMAVSRFRPKSVVLFSDSYGILPDDLGFLRAYEYVPSGPEGLARQRGRVSNQLVDALRIQGAEEDEEEAEGEHVHRFDEPVQQTPAPIGAPAATTQRIYFREFTAGDETKQQAISNISQTGGGARDLRMPHRAFGPLMEKMLPDRRQVQRMREKQSGTLEIYSGTLHYPVNPDDPQGEESTIVIDYEPPTTARSAEGRIPRIHEIPSLRDVPEGHLGRTFLLLVQNSRDEIRAHYVTEDDLNQEGWDPDLVRTILACVETTSTNHVVQGFIDYTTGEHYCHG